MTTQSIGIFDSGLGGLTVMNAIIDLLPHENIIYFGDTKNLPYGSKSEETIVQCCKKNILFLESLGVKLIVIACHTASIIFCTQPKRDRSPFLISMIDPTLALLKHMPKKGHLALLGTKNTISSGIYQKMILSQMKDYRITAIACPLFVPLVEEGYSNHPIAQVITKNYLSPLKKEKVDSLLLGCTHYPLLKKTIKKELPFPLKLIDPSNKCADLVKKTLSGKGLLNEERTKPLYQFFVSDNPERFLSLAKGLLNYSINHVSLAKSIISNHLT